MTFKELRDLELEMEDASAAIHERKVNSNIPRRFRHINTVISLLLRFHFIFFWDRIRCKYHERLQPIG